MSFESDSDEKFEVKEVLNLDTQRVLYMINQMNWF